jgi:oligoendopeptidase F
MDTLSYRWNLEALVTKTDLDSLAQPAQTLEESLASLESFRARLSPDVSVTDFSHAMDAYEAMAIAARRLTAYTFLRFAEDTQSQSALNQQNRVNQLVADAENRTLFFEHWFKSLPDETARRLIDASGDRRYFLESWRRFKPFTLSEPEERIITLKDVNGVDALVTLYDMLTSAFTFSLELDGERKMLTENELASYVRDPSAEKRAAAYRELYRVYTEHSTVLAQIYDHRARDWHAEMILLRHFSEPIAARNTMNDLPDAVVNTLLDVCRSNAHVFQRYFRLKANWLKMDRLRRYDIYAPLASSEKRYELPQAIDMVLDSFADFSPILAEQMHRVLDDAHFDPQPRPGKRGGAFCYSALPALAPWVLMNFNGRSRDIATLAHEMGHAIHSMMAGGHSVLAFDAAEPLAETASVFSEMLLAERLLAAETDPAVRREMLAAMVDDAYVTVQRQACLSIFERDAHRLVAEGATTDDLTACYLANLAEQFGDAVEVSDEFRWEWLLVPHIYRTPFYTYAYSFGQLLVLALFQRYRVEGESFKPKYLKILAYGGSASPIAILSEAGLDITAPAFWQGGFDLIAAWIDELERASTVARSME